MWVFSSVEVHWSFRISCCVTGVFFLPCFSFIFLLVVFFHVFLNVFQCSACFCGFFVVFVVILSNAFLLWLFWGSTFMCAVTIERSLNRLCVRCTQTRLHEIKTREESDILVDTWLKFHQRYPPVLPMSVDVLAEVADLAQVDCTHVNDMNWENLYRAVVCHIANLPDDTNVIASRPRGDTMCVSLLHRWAGCPGWHAPDACDRLWHPEFIEALLNNTPTWFWVPRLVICRQHQRALGLQRRQGEGVLTCTDPNCTRSHAPDWHRAELLSFHWLVKHHRLAGLGVGYALDGSLLHISQRQARRILADMPYVDEDFYHSFRWHKPIPAPRPYGDMIVTATSRRANLNEQPRRRDTTPRRATTSRRSPSRPRHGSPRPRPQQDHPVGMPPRKAPPVPPPVAEPYDVTRDPWAAPTPYPDNTPAPVPARPNPPELPAVITAAVTPRRI